MHRSLGFWRTWGLVVGSAIGSAVFVTPALRQQFLVPLERALDRSGGLIKRIDRPDRLGAGVTRLHRNAVGCGPAGLLVVNAGAPAGAA